MRQQRAIRTRQAILETAAAVFDERGYTSASIAEILERSGISKGALYIHFPTKEDLAAASFAEQLAVALPPQESTVQELVDSGLVLTYRLQTEPLVRASVALSLEQGATGLAVKPRHPPGRRSRTPDHISPDSPNQPQEHNTTENINPGLNTL